MIAVQTAEFTVWIRRDISDNVHIAQTRPDGGPDTALGFATDNGPTKGQPFDLNGIVLTVAAARELAGALIRFAGRIDDADGFWTKLC